MGKASSVIDEIAALIPDRVGVGPWWERVDETQAAMLADIHAGWRAGKFGTKKRTAARAISDYLGRHGITIGVQGVETWLTRNAGQ